MRDGLTRKGRVLRDLRAAGNYESCGYICGHNPELIDEMKEEAA